MKSAFEFPRSVTVTDQEIDLSHLSAEEKAFALQVADDAFLHYERFQKPRAIFGIAGPSGAGKSLLAALVKEIARTRSLSLFVETVSVDGFHLPNEYLVVEERDGVNLRAVRVRYDTYDTQLLAGELARFREGGAVRFPAYSRKIHDPVPGAVAIAEPNTLLILEGLWLLFEDAGWKFVRDELDHTYFLDDELDRLRRHTILRHVRGGRDEKDAARFYDKSDMENYRLVMRTKKFADQFLSWPTAPEKRKTDALS